MPQPLTQLLQRVSEGDRSACDSLLPLVYDELRQIAGKVMHGGKGTTTLQATILVHDLYVKLIDREDGHSQVPSAWNDRRHFFGVAAKAMRNMLSDHARRGRAHKRGGEGWQRVTLSEAMVTEKPEEFDLIDLDDALLQLERVYPRIAQVVELRFLGGLTLEEVAASLDITDRTVRRDWRTGQAFLRSRLIGEALPDGQLPDGQLPDGQLPDGQLPDGQLSDG